MRVFLMLAVVIPSALVIGWLVRSRLRARFDEQGARRRRINQEAELLRGEYDLLDDVHDLELTQQMLAEKAARQERRRHDRNAARHTRGEGR